MLRSKYFYGKPIGMLADHIEGLSPDTSCTSQNSYALVFCHVGGDDTLQLPWVKEGWGIS
jgi:hypothetical protein